MSELNYDLEDCTNAWAKKVEQYAPNLVLPQTFQELLNANFGGMCSFCFSLAPASVNEDTTSLSSSAHNFLETKKIKAAKTALKKYNKNILVVSILDDVSLKKLSDEITKLVSKN